MCEDELRAWFVQCEYIWIYWDSPWPTNINYNSTFLPCRLVWTMTITRQSTCDCQLMVCTWQGWNILTSSLSKIMNYVSEKYMLDMVNMPIIEHMPITKHLFIYSLFFVIFCYFSNFFHGYGWVKWRFLLFFWLLKAIEWSRKKHEKNEHVQITKCFKVMYFSFFSFLVHFQWYKKIWVC